MTDGSDLVGLDGRPLNDELVTPSEYLGNLGRRSGFSSVDREFLRKNLPSVFDTPQHMSKSQRQIAALQKACMEMSIQTLQLWGLLGAFAERSGSKVAFTRKELDKFQRPDSWPVVLLEDDEDGHQVVVVKLGEFKGVTKTDPQLSLPLEDNVGQA